MNPQWTQKIYRSFLEAVRTCPHCGKRGVYAHKKDGEYHVCKHCQRRFQEKKGKPDARSVPLLKDWLILHAASLAIAFLCSQKLHDSF